MFSATRRRQTPSSWWNIYSRESKKLLRSIDRDNAGSSVDLRLHFDNILYLTSNYGIHAIDVVGSSRPQMTSVLNMNSSEDRIEAVDFTVGSIVMIVYKGSNLQVQIHPLISRQKSDTTQNFELLPDMPELSQDFEEKKCSCLSVQVKSSICMSILSNNRGSFEYIGGKAYVLIVFTNLVTKECLRILKLDSNWMHKMSDMLVPYDNESCMLEAKFSKDFLAVGFGSFSDRKDGAIAMWKMSELLSSDISEDDLSIWTIPAPTYHWGSWDGHTGGVNNIHIDSLGMIASNACTHQVTTRCIERCDESKKDNVLIYDFWHPGEDSRREQQENAG